MAVLSNQCPCTIDEALSYLKDQGSPADNQDLLIHHLNGISAMMMTATARQKLLWVSDDEVIEYRDSSGNMTSMYLRNAPVQKLTSVTLWPHQTSPIVIACPVPPSTFTDDVYFDPVSGLVQLKTQKFPDARAGTKFVYEAGYLTTDYEYDNLRMIALSVLATKWGRYKGNRHGVQSETRRDQSVNYTTQDFTDFEMKDLRRYRRSLFA